MEAGDLAQRATVARIRCGVVDDDVVCLGLRREVSVYDFGLDPAVLLRVLLETFQSRLEFVLYRRPVLIARPPSSPLQAVELVEIEKLEHFIERDVANDASSPERR